MLESKSFEQRLARECIASKYLSPHHVPFEERLLFRNLQPVIV
jgi:hypothetical protein